MEKFRFFASRALGALLIIIFFALETSLGRYFTLFGQTPALLPLAVALASFMTTPRTGAALGGLAGFLMGTYSNLGVLWIFFYFPAGYLMGLLSERVRINILSSSQALLLLPLRAAVLSALAYFAGQTPDLAAHARSLGAQAVFTLASLPVAYPLFSLVRRISGPPRGEDGLYA